MRQALLEADVNYDVAQEFVERVTERSVGDEVLKSLSPTEHIIGIVHQELVDLMGPVDHSLHLQKGGVSIIRETSAGVRSIKHLRGVFR